MSEAVETAELLAFSKTVDAKSVSQAAKEIGVPRATVSRRLARLEERLGVRLLRRTTRSLVLTDAGEELYRHARIVLDAIAQAEASVRRTDERVRGELRIALPPISDVAFHDLLADFAERYPDVRMHVHFATQIVDLRRDGYDVALRGTLELEPGLVARTLGRMPLVAVASAAYLARHGTPRTAKDLAKHRLLLGFARGYLPLTHWPLLKGGRIQVQGAMTSNDLDFVANAALRGLGIALQPQFNVARELESGELVHVLPSIIGAETRLSLVYVERELMPPALRAFIDTVLAWTAGFLGAPRQRGRKVEATVRPPKRRSVISP